MRLYGIGALRREEAEYLRGEKPLLTQKLFSTSWDYRDLLWSFCYFLPSIIDEKDPLDYRWAIDSMDFMAHFFR